MLNEQFGGLERACAFLCMVGAVFMTKPCPLCSVIYHENDNGIQTLIITSVFLGAIAPVLHILQFAPAEPGTFMCISEIFFASLFRILIFSENPDYINILGAIMILGVSKN
ncbi:hypothetical protein BDC45DRAFT_541953 [Circinella umbellata]|nr:hypothetical protein BDC45DRAFT_541953 [Circinella umbellata]